MLTEKDKDWVASEVNLDSVRRTEKIRREVRKRYNQHDVEAIFRAILVDLCESCISLYDALEEHGIEMPEISISKKHLSELLSLNELVEAKKEEFKI